MKSFLGLVICCALFAGCEQPSSPPASAPANAPQRNEGKFYWTTGNNSFIPLWFQHRSPSDKIPEILAALADFEAAHPELEVISWQVEKEQHAHMIVPTVFGIWVHHRKRAMTPEYPK